MFHRSAEFDTTRLKTVSPDTQGKKRTENNHSRVTRSSVTGKSMAFGSEGGVGGESFQVIFTEVVGWGLMGVGGGGGGGGEGGGWREATTQLVFTVVNLRRNSANKPEKNDCNTNQDDLCSFGVKMGWLMNRHARAHARAHTQIKARGVRKLGEKILFHNYCL